MRHLFFFVFISSTALTMINCQNTTSNQVQSNELTTEEVDQGWTLLFDGKTLDGWRGIGRQTVPKEHWIIEDGAIRKLNSGLVPTLPDGRPAEGADLMTIEAYDNYELYFEWKI